MQDTKPEEMSVEQWVETIASSNLRECIKNDGRLYDPQKQLCAANGYCPFRINNNRCKIHGPSQEGDTYRLMEKHRRFLKGPSVEDCIEGGQNFYLGGICLLNEKCIFQTNVLFRIKGECERIKTGRLYPKCTKHYTPVMCVSGKRLMREKNACLLTNIAMCGYQDPAKSVVINNNTYDGCSYSV